MRGGLGFTWFLGVLCCPFCMHVLALFHICVGSYELYGVLMAWAYIFSGATCQGSRLSLSPRPARFQHHIATTSQPNRTRTMPCIHSSPKTNYQPTLDSNLTQIARCCCTSTPVNVPHWECRLGNVFSCSPRNSDPTLITVLL